jgi:hypothetical protein
MTKYKLNEDEHQLVTPSFIGTDEEKIGVLTFWSEMISKIRSINSYVVSHENKLAIVAQLKKELELIDLEINNVTSHPVQHADGGTEMSQVAPDNSVDLSIPEPIKYQTESKKNSVFDTPKISIIEQMQRIAGTYYDAKSKEAAIKRFLKS